MKNILRKLIMLFIVSCVFLCSYHTSVNAEEVSYIYFDLSADNVTISNDAYSGKIYQTIGGVTTEVSVSGKHNANNKYYVYQSSDSNKSTTGLVDGVFILPEYNQVMVEDKTWDEYVTNNTDVVGIIDKWNSVTSGVRTATDNKILVSAYKTTCDVTIDNIWSTHQKASEGLSGGGISVNNANTAGTHVTVRIKGDNRLGSIRYYSTHKVSSNTSNYSSLTFTSFDGDESINGSLTVIGNQKLTRSNANYTKVNGGSNNVTENHWDSVIGGTDHADAVYGLYIKGATIYSGATARENCTAIGGGGNGMGNVMISGGLVTAVSATTGTAIGGGIAHTATGGTSDVVISGGRVYAYNFGQPAHEVISNYGTSDKNVINAAAHIAGTAIGGASSILSAGNGTTAYVKITGGYVYAESLGGCGIGAGNSVNTTAGSANVTITGGEVIANSKGETITFADGKTFDVKPGVSIGGGSGGIAGNGGSATIKISGGIIKTGSIGGGSTRSTKGHKIGYANITITGGDISGQFIMVKGGTSACKFNMSGGTIHDSNTTDGQFVKLQENGGAVYMDDPSGVATVSGGTIENCTAINGGAIYMTAGEFTLSGTGEIKNCSTIDSNGLGGAIFLGKTGDVKGTFTMTGGSISGNKAIDGLGGAIYLDGGDATISGGTIELNEALNGGGAYLAGGTLNISSGTFKGNIATHNGGGAYVSGGNINMSGGSFERNKAGIDGGGVAVFAGNFNISSGTIGGKDLANNATNGGGVYVSGGNVLIYGSGTISHNTAEENGGGVYVANGNVTMIGGVIDSNDAKTGDGGGIYVSSTGNDVKVQILSGSITNNTASKDGGALSVVGTANGQEVITVTIGVDENHFDENGNRINCDHKEIEGAISSETCPIIEGNEASKKGGAVYITGGSATHLNIYCLIEENNASLDDKDRSNFMMVEGGTVVISTCKDINDEDSPATYGNSFISDSLHIEAGSLDIYGSMSNPLFKDSITVNITREEDHFGDHRTQTTSGKKYYKVQYFENFTETSGLVTGEYTVYQYAEGETMTISGVVFSHPGYEIIGWFTEKNGGGIAYDVGQKVTFLGEDAHDLIIYAIWTAHSYYVEFNPNVPDGVTFEGNMPSVQYTYNTKYKLPLNNFIYPGYIFTGWVSSNGKSYVDGQEVSNLSGIDGAIIILTAQWAKCNHDPNNTEFRIIYSYTAEDNVLKKSCNCRGHSETITIITNNYTYDEKAHPASLKESHGVWAETMTLIYLKDEIEVDSPINAGNYEVKLSYGGATAVANFIIYKAEWDAPNKPTFTPQKDEEEWKIIVFYSEIDPDNMEYEYRISYYAYDKIIDLDWQKDNQFSLPITYTNYLIYIRYAADENHNPSVAVRADQMYYYSVEVSIIIDCCDGFLCTLEKNDTSGLNIDVKVLDGYYKSQEFKITAVTKIAGTDTESQEQAKVNDDYSLLYNIPSGTDNTKYIITLTVVGAKKKASVTSFITENKVFGDVTTTIAKIANDSAFTTYFKVKDYAEYSELSISFNKALPTGTSIILIDKATNTYWYFNFSSPSNTILISEFIQMGGIDKFIVNGNVLNYQFIIDFSKVESGFIEEKLTIGLDAKKSKDDVPEFSEIYNGITLDLVSASFTIVDKSESETLEKEMKYNYSIAEDAEASKWEDKAISMVVTPNTTLPKDTRIKFAQGNFTTYYYQNEKGLFIIPLTDLSLNNFNITLESNLFPEEEMAYKVNIKLYGSNSSVGTAVLNGIILAEINEVIFTTSTKSTAAIKITGEKHVVAPDGQIKVDIEYIVPDGCSISSDIMVKAEDGEYTSSGKRPIIEKQGELTISLEGLVEGSYCFKVIIKDSAGITVMNVPYYFIIINNSLTVIQNPTNQ